MQALIHPLSIVASLAMGASVWLAVWTVERALRRANEEEAGPWRYDVNRLRTLRDTDAFYRVFESVIQALARLNRALAPALLPGIDRDLVLGGASRAWLPEEYLARLQILTVLMLPLYIGGGVMYFGFAGLWAGLAAGLFTLLLLRRQLRRRALQRQQAIKRQLPFLLDLLTLLMYAGIGFLQALRQAVAEFEGQPIAHEFGRALADMQMGKTRSDAFDALRLRLRDDDVTSLVGAILQSEKLGSPLAEVLRTQADVLRLKRSQRAEALAGEAGVNMLLPAVLVMAATVMIILGPFMLNIFVLAWEL